MMGNYVNEIKLIINHICIYMRRSGSENYEHLGDLNGPDERLSSSDHSDKFSQIYMYGSENGDIISSKKRHLHQGTGRIL